MGFKWTTTELRLVQGMVADGLSASKIARRLTAKHGIPFTRNQMVGVIIRNGLRNYGPPSPPKRYERRAV